MEIVKVWEDLLFFGHCVGGDLELQGRGGILKGRINCFQIDYLLPIPIVRFFATWIIKFNPDVEGGWEMIDWPVDEPMLGLIMDEAIPELDSAGNIQIIPTKHKRRFPVTIYPKEILELAP